MAVLQIREGLYPVRVMMAQENLREVVVGILLDQVRLVDRGVHCEIWSVSVVGLKSQVV